MILVTGGAGFIGANFVLDWLAASDEANEFASLCLQMLQQPQDGCTNRTWVEQNFTWPATLAPLSGYLGNVAV